VLLKGNTFVESSKIAEEMAHKTGRALIHPYDDPKVIAGNGTIGLEMLQQCPDLDVLIVPVGGGGLMAGISIVARTVNPKIELIGVESEVFPSMHNKLYSHNAPVGLKTTLAEGIAIKVPGELTQDILTEQGVEIRVVKESLIEEAIDQFLTHEHIVVEGAAAAPLALLLNDPEPFRGKRVGLVISGGNIDARVLASILMRGLVRKGTLIRILVEIKDNPGVLAKVSHIIGLHGANIIKVEHQRIFQAASAKAAELEFMLETQNRTHAQKIIAALNDGEFPTRLVEEDVG